MVKVYLPSLRKPESNHSNYFNNYAILNKLSIITSTKTLTFLVSFESFGTELARIGMGSHIKQKPEGNPFGRTINNYNYGWCQSRISILKHLIFPPLCTTLPTSSYLTFTLTTSSLQYSLAPSFVQAEKPKPHSSSEQSHQVS